MASSVMVCVKRTVDAAVKVHATQDRRGTLTQGLKHAMNPFCEVALEEALRLKQKGFFQRVFAVCVGGPSRTAQKQEPQTDVLLHALAMGADEAYLYTTTYATDLELQPLAVAKTLRRVVQQQQPALVLLGKQSIDGDNQQVPQLLAGLLQWPQATCASSVEVTREGEREERERALPDAAPRTAAASSFSGVASGAHELSAAGGGRGTLRVQRQIDCGVQLVEMPLPAVVSCDLRLNVPRHVTLPNLMKAKKKKKIYTAEALATLQPLSAADLEPRCKILSVEQSPSRTRKCYRVKNVDELIQKLQHEAKVLKT